MIMKLTEKPAAASTAQILLLLNAGIWFLLAVIFLRIGGQSLSISTWIVSTLMPGNALVMAFLAIGLGWRRRAVFYLALAVLVINILLTLTDEFGLFDLIALIMTSAILLLLIGAKSHLLPEP